MKDGLAGKVKRDRDHEVGKKHVQRRKVHTQSTTTSMLIRIGSHLIVKKSNVKNILYCKKVYTNMNLL